MKESSAEMSQDSLPPPSSVTGSQAKSILSTGRWKNSLHSLNTAIDKMVPDPLKVEDKDYNTETCES